MKFLVALCVLCFLANENIYGIFILKVFVYSLYSVVIQTQLLQVCSREDISCCICQSF